MDAPRLFDRTTRSLCITKEGQAFPVHVKRILAEVEAARSGAAVQAGHYRP